MKEELSNKEKKVYDYLKKFIFNNGYAPSVRDICKGVDIKSTSTIFSYLNKLEKKNYIQKKKEVSRSIIINEENKVNETKDNTNSTIYVPIIGKISAGIPILAEENIEGEFPIPENFIKTSNELFMLNVKGDSMVDAGILNDDYVLIKKQETANNRDIIAALIGDEATVKTFYKEKDHVRLQPENKFYEPIIVKDNLRVIGKVVGVFRRL